MFRMVTRFNEREDNGSPTNGDFADLWFRARRSMAPIAPESGDPPALLAMRIEAFEFLVVCSILGRVKGLGEPGLCALGSGATAMMWRFGTAGWGQAIRGAQRGVPRRAFR
jgi:hypothetical protein